MVSSFRTIEGLQTRIDVQNAASFFFLYATVKRKAMCYILTRSDFDFQSFIYFYYKNKQKKSSLRNVKSVSAYALRTLLFSRRKRTFQDRDSKDQNSLDPERQQKD